nr:hypothetical protein Iba_chr04fCG3210 [Ipomoea batatas]
MWANVRRGGNVRLGADTWRHMRWSVQITPLPHHWRVRCLRLLPCLSSSSKVGWGWMGSAWLGLLFGSSSPPACFLQAFLSRGRRMNNSLFSCFVLSFGCIYKYIIYALCDFIHVKVFSLL